LSGNSRAILALPVALGLALAGCHDWDRFSRASLGDGAVAPADGAVTPTDGGSTGELSGEVSGDFACAAPYVLVPVMERGSVARIERIALGGATPVRCAALRVWGFREGEPIRAVAVQGERVLAAGDSGGCVLEVSSTTVRGRFSSYPIGNGAQVRDAFVFNDGTPRFAVAMAVNTSGAINNFVTEGEPGALTRVMTSSSSPRIPAALIGGGFIRAIASDPAPPHRLYVAREASDYVISALADGSERRIVRESGNPELYESIAVGTPYMRTEPHLAMTTRNGGSRFAFVTGATGSSGVPCMPCTTVSHVLPLDTEARTYAVLCSDANPEPPGLYVYRPSSCGAVQSFAAGALLGRAAIKYP
jgi:hypothetical protein